MTGFALWRIAARIAATVFCSGTKPAEAPPTGDRYLGRPCRPEPVSWMKRAALAAAACAIGQAKRLEGEREGGGVEIAGRQHDAVVGSTSGLSAARVELDLDGVAGPLDGIEQRAVDRGHAADRQRILQVSPARLLSARSQQARNSAAARCLARTPGAPPAGADRACRGWRPCLPWSARPPAAAGRRPSSASTTASAPCPTDTAEALISDSPSLGARRTGARPAAVKRLRRRQAAAPDTRPRLRRSACEPSAVISTRSPAPIEPSDGMTGCTPALSAADQRRQRPPARCRNRRPPASRRGRTSSRARSRPAADRRPQPLRPSINCRWKAPASPSTSRAEIGAEPGVQAVDALARGRGSVEHRRAPCARRSMHRRRDSPACRPSRATDATSPTRKPVPLSS